jgi:DNA-binding NarL/FixJ family response regulator
MILRKLKGISELNIPSTLLKKINRSQIPMIIIDDNKFMYQEILQAHDFNIKHVEDIDAINFVNDYEVILCDINGVGKKFGSRFDGAHLIAEIRKKYPFKYIIAYTGHTHDPSYTKYLMKADSVINKDVSTDEWIEELDIAITNTVNPINKWQKIRNYLIENKVEIQLVAKLEDEYVRAIISNKDLTNFPNNRNVKNLSSEIKEILISFSRSIIFKLLFSM